MADVLSLLSEDSSQINAAELVVDGLNRGLLLDG